MLTNLPYIILYQDLSLLSIVIAFVAYAYANNLHAVLSIAVIPYVLLYVSLL